MNLESQIFEENGKYSFDILQMDDILIVGEGSFPEHLFTSKDFAREQTAERNAAKWISDFDTAGEPKRRRLCGFDTVGSCTVQRVVPPVRRRANK